MVFGCLFVFFFKSTKAKMIFCGPSMVSSKLLVCLSPLPHFRTYFYHTFPIKLSIYTGLLLAFHFCAPRPDPFLSFSSVTLSSPIAFIISSFSCLFSHLMFFSPQLFPLFYSSVLLYSFPNEIKKFGTYLLQILFFWNESQLNSYQSV